MGLKKWATCRKYFLNCIKPKNTILGPKVRASSSKQISSQRLLLSDVSDPGSPFSLSDLSISLADLHVFTRKELILITKNFSKCNYLGEGGFGPVYKGFIEDNLRPTLKAQPVAVKVLDLDGTQGHMEWLAEVVFLGQLKHPNLVNLIGYSYEGQDRLLVYEYMPEGNLEHHLFRRHGAALPWLTRLKIILGAAKGLCFLHEEATPVIYRDFKTSNILLDQDYNAKLSDFGLATDGPDGEKSHVTTCVMGTEGYAAPEYIKTGHLTTMSDVFSFGVVLLELLTGRRSVDNRRHGREKNLAEWARPLLKDHRKLEGMMDRRLEGQYSIEGARKLAALAYRCLSSNPKSRPTMSSVIKTLEPVLELKDIPVGPFVYIVPVQGENECDNVKKNIKELDLDEVRAEEKIEEKEEKIKKVRQRHQKVRRHRHRRKAIGRAIHSDTELYRTLKSSLYS
ncbi:hypothetical protein SLE2022_385410 [Rubroshorea leprosula]